MRKEGRITIMTPGEWLDYEKEKKGWFNEYVPYIVHDGIKVPVHIQGITEFSKIAERVKGEEE